MKFGRTTAERHDRAVVYGEWWRGPQRVFAFIPHRCGKCGRWVWLEMVERTREAHRQWLYWEGYKNWTERKWKCKWCP